MFNSWPGWYQVLWGVTWGNNVAALEWLLVVGTITWIIKRYLIGKTGIFKAIGDMIREPIKEHVDARLAEHHESVRTMLADHHNNIIHEIGKRNEEKNT